MCGIFGITSKSENIVPLLIQNLKYLSYRGYDSTGICLQSPLSVYKTVGDVEKLGNLSNSRAFSGIGHTRWATHGKQSLENAHPHLSHDTVAIVHNGIIHNHLALRSELEKSGYTFLSETDSEVIAHLLHQLLQTNPPMEALEALGSRLEGRYAFIALLSSDTDRIYGLSNNLPLLIGKNETGYSVASDVIALRHCGNYAQVPNLVPFYLGSQASSISETFRPLPNLPIGKALKKDITWHEILSQHTIPLLLGHWHPLDIPKPQHVLFIACGSSFHCAELAHHWFQAQGIYTTLEVASELKHKKLTHLKDSLIIAISQSGETADTVLSMESVLQTEHLHSIAITNTPTSRLANLCETVIPLNIGVERGVASTKAVTAQMIILFHLAHQFSKIPVSFPDKVLSQAIASLYTLKSIPKAAQKISKYPNILCLGKHTLRPIASECALKLKELTYLHAEALAQGELKHGPLALIDERTFSIILGEKDAIATQTCLSEIQARGGPTLCIGPNQTEGIETPKVPGFDFLIINIACQLLSYHVAKALKRPIDQPRNLAKSVTVE